MGERGPNYNEQLRGLLYGLSLNHSRTDIVIAFYEGIAMFLRMICEEVTRAAEITPASHLMTGQLGISPLFSRLCSYLIAETSCVPQHSQSTAIGAAMLGIREIEGSDYCDLAAHLPKPVPNRVERAPDFERYLSGKYDCFIETYRLLAQSVRHQPQK